MAQLAMSELGTDAMTLERTTGLVMRTERRTAGNLLRTVETA
ncbi:hypothetical protein ABQZ69_14260 [Xanthomonas sp. WHRI 8391]|nr:hypothetical protein [Xanthomonas hortorum]